MKMSINSTFTYQPTIQIKSILCVRLSLESPKTLFLPYKQLLLEKSLTNLSLQNTFKDSSKAKAQVQDIMITKISSEVKFGAYRLVIFER